MISFNEQGARRIVQAVRRVEGSSPAPAIELPPANWQHVQCTGPVYDGEEAAELERDYYPGHVLLHDASAEATTPTLEVWLVDLNGAALTAERVYAARESGVVTIEGQPKSLFVTVAGGIASGKMTQLTIMECMRETTVIIPGDPEE